MREKKIPLREEKNCQRKKNSDYSYGCYRWNKNKKCSNNRTATLLMVFNLPCEANMVPAVFRSIGGNRYVKDSTAVKKHCLIKIILSKTRINILIIPRKVVFTLNHFNIIFLC